MENNNFGFTITPSVDQTQEFIEIANDFANPLDLVREAISNAFDANSDEIQLFFDTEVIFGETISVITIADNGDGMDRNDLQSFFDLGNSTRRLNKDTIGEKGHGTKIYFNSKKIVIETSKNGFEYKAILDSPFAKLHNREIPKVDVVQNKCDDAKNGTRITIYGYNNNRREQFTHSRLRDYVFWFTKFGSIESQFGVEKYRCAKIKLKGLDSDSLETLEFGHKFPEESAKATNLFEKYMVKAPDYYCRRFVKSGSLPKHPEIRYNAVFSVEGKKVKYDSNVMIRRPGYSAPDGAYTIQERYGLWLCKDYIPIQRKNEWITTKGSEYTKLHAFINCQSLRLTANRGAIDNTPAEILQDIESVVRSMFEEITEGAEWAELSYLESEAEGFNTVEKEKKNFKLRIKKANSSNIMKYRDVILVEPQRESGVESLVVQLITLRPELFPFTIIDYDTHEGIDVIAKARDGIPIDRSRLYYVEFKYNLSTQFNHSFENTFCIVCWDTDLKHGASVEDINKEERVMEIIPPKTNEDYTRYYLTNPRRAHRIEIFVLKYYLPKALNGSFRPRTNEEIF